jgi:hypothetical protein
MKKLILQLLVCLMVTTLAQAQAPHTINYQAVVRNNAGEVIKNQNVRFRLSITEGLNGATVYSETNQVTTNMLGLVNISIGSGVATTGSISSINWGGISKYLKIEIDITGGTNFILMGSQQLVSVPYSLHSNTASSVLNQWQFNPNGIHYNLGKVGIGTALPEAKLAIQADGDGLGNVENRILLTLKNTSTSYASSTNMLLSAGNSNVFTVLNHNASTYSVLNGYADFGILASTGPGLVLRAQSGVLRFESGMNGTTHLERMRITNDGNIGIGTIAPKAKLAIQAEGDGLGTVENRVLLTLNNTSNSSASSTNMLLSAGNSNVFTVLNHNAASYSVLSGYADFGILASTGPGLVMRAQAGVLRFESGMSGNLHLERMRITNDGNIGIGTTVPKAKLEVKDGDVYVNDPTKGIILKSPNGGCWRVTIDNTGNFVRTAITCPN